MGSLISDGHGHPAIDCEWCPPIYCRYSGYIEDEGIQDKSTCTETFAAAVLHVHNPRWDGVPFVLKAGKGLNDSKVELRVQFHSVPGVVDDLEHCVANELVVRF
mgnify:CR=1 FL=1|jgi:glucose-6-phosphate 1-dehydrogenase